MKRTGFSPRLPVPAAQGLREAQQRILAGDPGPPPRSTSDAAPLPALAARAASGITEAGPPRQGQSLLHARLLHAASAPLPRKILDLYAALNLPVTADTRPAYARQDLTPAPTILAAGRHGVLYSVKLPKPGGGEFDAVFKPLVNDERSWVAHEVGIPRDDPQIAMRNIATLAYARELLGFDVVADTRVAALPVGPHRQAEGPKLGLLMEKAPGRPAVKTDPAVLERADVRAEVMRLQLLDHLTGQGDRHGANYFIDVQAGRAKVTGIDNDLSFGLLTDPEGTRRGEGAARDGFHGTAMPPVVDIDMARQIVALTPERIRGSLRDKLGEAEVEAAVARHEGVMRHVGDLHQQGRVIAPADWDQAWVTQLLNRDNSYIGRERAALAKA